MQYFFWVFSELQRQGPLQISHGKEERINGAYGSRSHGGHKFDRDDTIRDGTLLYTLDRRGGGQMYHSSFDSDKHYDSHYYHPYRRIDKGYFPSEFKKEKPPTFDWYVKKMEDVEDWILGLNKFFELHNYTDNMKAVVVIFSLRDKVDIYWEYLKWIRDIKIEDLIWHEFKGILGSTCQKGTTMVRPKNSMS